jgi:hypothetical protein
MSNIRQRLARLERSARTIAPANVCAGCADLSPITIHWQYTLASGETILLPPRPDTPPCTCGRRSKDERIRAMIFSSHRPTVMATRDEAERHYAEYAALRPLWRGQQ